MSGPARAFAHLVVFLRFPIVLAWIVGAAWLTVNLPTLAEAQTGSLGDLVPTSSEAIEAELRSKRLFGLAAYVFQGGLGHAGITYYVVFASSVLLLALGSDYNVFLVGRIWREARRRPLAEAVRVAGARAATSITVAGLVLALSFALMALVPIRPFRELAFTMAAGLLIDAFLVRTLLVPALIVLIGERSAWPNRRMAVASKSRLPD